MKKRTKEEKEIAKCFIKLVVMKQDTTKDYVCTIFVLVKGLPVQLTYFLVFFDYSKC